MEKKLAKEFNNKGFDLFKQNLYQEAIYEFDKALELNSSYKEAYYNRALSLFLLSRYSESISSIDSALDINERYSKALNLKGLVLTSLNRFYEASLIFEKQIDVGSEDGSYYYNKGISLSNFDFAAAIENFNKAIDLKFDVENCLKEIHQLEEKSDLLNSL
jgi:tetratricopeptide (TPR) repeat protein